jgi:hypothetical protein
MHTTSKSLVLSLFAAASLAGCAVSADSAGAANDEDVAVASEAVTSTDTLLPGQSLSNNQALVSANGRYKAVMQAIDSHFVIYDVSVSPQIAIWSTPVFGPPGWTANMQADGNFVIYLGPTPMWSTHTVGAADGNYYLRLENDGALTIHRTAPSTPDTVIWRSNGLNVWATENFGAGSTTFTADTAALGGWNNQIQSLTNPSSQWFTVFAGENFSSRCQVIPPGATFNNLTNANLGPQQISSIQPGVHCTAQTKTVQVYNLSGVVQRYRIVTNAGPGPWSGLVSDGTTLSYDANARWLAVEQETWILGGYINDWVFYYQGSNVWARDADPLIVDDLNFNASSYATGHG